MPLNTGLISTIAILAFAGCSKKPAESDIGMGPPAAVSTDAQARAEPAPVVAVLGLKPITAGEGQTERVIESCNVEQVNGQTFAGTPVVVAKGAPISVSGWVIDEVAPGSAELRFVNVADASTYAVGITTDVAREDVAKSFQADPVSVKPGFNVVFTAGALQSGDYRLQVVIPSAEQGAAACDNGRVISLTD